MSGYTLMVGSSDAISDTMLSGPAGARPTVLGRLHGGSSSMSDHRFWAKVTAVPSGCWEYRTRNSGGYGSVKRRGRTISAHRWSYEIAHGPLPPGAHVLHRCDNPPCVNPAHLFLGSAKDNAVDRETKGRRPGAHRIAEHAQHSGERNGRAKVTAAEVEAMREAHSAGESVKSLSVRYGVSVTTAHRIVTRRAWK